MPTPPNTEPPPTPTWRASCRRCSSICAASSRVGAMTSARVAPRRPARRCRIGSRNAAVLPLPVTAHARTSLPPRACGMVSAWIGVGILKPISSTARKRPGLRLKDVNDMMVDPSEGAAGPIAVFHRSVSCTPLDAEDAAGKRGLGRTGLASEPAIGPDRGNYTRRRRRSPRCPVISPSAALLALSLALSHLVGEEIERERAGRLVGVDVLAVELAAAHEQLVDPVQRGAAAERDGHGLGDDLAAKRLRRRTAHRMFSFARIFSSFARDRAERGKGPDRLGPPGLDPRSSPATGAERRACRITPIMWSSPASPFAATSGNATPGPPGVTGAPGI